jgi:hypothetical protein
MDGAKEIDEREVSDGGNGVQTQNSADRMGMGKNKKR